MSEAKRTSPVLVSQSPSLELRRLEPLVGSWSVEGYAQASLAGPACTVRSRETFAWLDGGYFLVQHYDTQFGDQPTQRGVMYWGYDTAAKRFLLHFFSNNGPFTREGNIYHGEIHRDRLVFTGPARFAIALDRHGRIKVNDDEAIDTDWELRDARGAWRPWMRDTYRKIR